MIRESINTRDTLKYDEGLRQFMLGMYNHTAAGLALSGVVAWFVFSSGLLYQMASSMVLFAFAPLLPRRGRGIGRVAGLFTDSTIDLILVRKQFGIT